MIQTEERMLHLIRNTAHLQVIETIFEDEYNMVVKKSNNLSWRKFNSTFNVLGFVKKNLSFLLDSITLPLQGLQGFVSFFILFSFILILFIFILFHFILFYFILSFYPTFLLLYQTMAHQICNSLDLLCKSGLTDHVIPRRYRADKDQSYLSRDLPTSLVNPEEVITHEPACKI